MTGKNTDEIFERNDVFEKFRDWIELPMLLLGIAWLVLLLIELTRGLTSTLEFLTTLIWIFFVVEFAVELSLSPQKVKYLRHNWLTVVSLIVPALRILRIARFVRVFSLSRATRGLRLVKIIGSLNRAINGLRTNLSRYGAGYIGIMSLIVTTVGAGGMYAFESNLTDGPSLESYWDALWWTAMIMTTLGSQFWPRTAEGRILGFLLSLYAFGVFGYVTGALASFFMGRNREAQSTSHSASLDQLTSEIRKLREDLARLLDDQ